MYKSFLGKIILLSLMIVAGMSLASLFSGFWIEAESLFHEQAMETQFQRNKVRGVLALGHFFSFVIPGIIYLLLIYRANSKSFMGLSASTPLNSYFWSLILLVVAYPFIAYITILNTSIEFPESLIKMEESSILLLEGILTMEHWSEFVVNFLLIALLPAIGEELIFRGILQNEIHDKWKNGHVAVLVTAFVFASIHLQIQSFLPKMALGVILGYAYILTRNIWVPVLLHLFNNGMQVVALFVMNKELGKAEDLEQQKIPVYIALISIALVFWAGKQLQRSRKY